jgi:hypothetical protein
MQACTFGQETLTGESTIKPSNPAKKKSLKRQETVRQETLTGRIVRQAYTFRQETLTKLRKASMHLQAENTDRREQKKKHPTEYTKSR